MTIVTSTAISVSGVIYGLHNGDGNIRYIGYTTQKPAARLQQHKDDSRRMPNRHLVRWILKHGAPNIRMEILESYEEIALSDLKAREVVRIAQAKAEGWSLVNGTEGGDGAYGYRHTEETKAKMGASSSARQLGVPKSPEHRANVSKAKKGVPLNLSDEERAARSERMTGRTLSAETRALISKNRSGIPNSPEARAKMSAALRGRPSPFKGKTHTAEARAKNSAANSGENSVWYGREFTEEHRANISAGKKGKPNRGSHTRWHVSRDIVKEDCVFCNE